MIGTAVLIIAIPIITYLGFSDIQLFAHGWVHTATFIFINLLGKGTASILTGCLLSVILYRGYLKWLPTGKWTTLILFIVALLFRSGVSPLFVPYLSVTIFDFLIGFIIIINLNPDNYFANFLNLPFMIKLGVLSYSIYIWQEIFTHIQPWAHLFKYADSPFVNLPVLFIVSYMSYHFYEKKFLKLKQRFTNVSSN
jgi:peptidoglycan/LPS O-acetylase OafA/YrhL